jgi:hypothetical protein
MPFDPSDDPWWPNPWPPRTRPVGGASYPYDWTDPFINARAAAFGPLASAPAPSTAASLGAMALHPPIFLNNGPSSFPGNPSGTAWPQPFSPGGLFGAGSSAAVPILGTPGASYTLGLGPKLPALAQLDSPERSLLSSNPSFRFGLFGPDPDPTSPFADRTFGAGDSATAPALGTPGASYTLGLGPKLPLAQLDSPAATGLLSSDPSFRFGLFGPDPDPTSPFAEGTFGAGSSAAIPTTTGTPGASYTLGLGPKLPPLSPFQSPVEASSPALDPLIGSADAPAAALPRSVLFNHPPAPWDLGAPERDLAGLDQSAQSLGPSELPISKSGQPIVPPRLPTAHEQALYAARLLSPNLVDYFTKTLPPPPPFPSTPGKIPSLDNPYAVPAALEAATWLLPEARIPGMVAGAVERGATEAALQAAKAVADSPALIRAAEQLVTGRYGSLEGTLPPGFQANHLNQNKVYEGVIPEDEGLSVAMKGNILTQPGTPHYNFHKSLEQFWDQYRPGGSLQYKMPTNAEYGEAVRRALIASGFSPAQATDLAGQAAAQRAAYGLSESADVPRIPGAIWRRRRN